MTIKARWFAFAVAMIVMGLHGPALADIIGTAPRVQDGDTFDLCEGQNCPRIRLCGIDAPESGTAGADATTAALHGLVAGQPVRCVQFGNGTPCDGRASQAGQ